MPQTGEDWVFTGYVNMGSASGVSFPAAAITDASVSAAAAIARSKLAQRVLGRRSIPLTEWRVWDALATPLPSDGVVESGVETASMVYTPATLDTPFFVAAGRAYRVVGITGRVEVAGTGGAATAVVKKAASATAITAGTALHTGSFNFVGTAATNQILALSATSTDLDIPTGTCIGLDATGTLTNATGTVTVLLTPAASPDDLRVAGQTYGSTAPYLSTGDVKAQGATTKRAACFMMLLDDYEDAETVVIRVAAGMVTTVADVTATVLVEAWRIDQDGTLGAANLVTTAAQSINSLTAAFKDFAVTVATLAKGDVLHVRLTVAVNDAATAGAVIGAVWGAELQADLR